MDEGAHGGQRFVLLAIIRLIRERLVYQDHQSAQDGRISQGNWFLASVPLFQFFITYKRRPGPNLVNRFSPKPGAILLSAAILF